MIMGLVLVALSVLEVLLLQYNFFLYLKPYSFDNCSLRYIHLCH